MTSRPRVPLRRLLDAAADDLRTQRAPALHARLPAPTPALVTAGPLPGRADPSRAWAFSALALLGLLGAVAWFGAMPPSGGEPDHAARQTAFVPLAPPERWSAAEVDAGWVVRGEWPAERLAALGLPFDPSRAAERVRAELLLHSTGEVLAVRLLR